MKNNTKEAKINLEKALRNIPNDFALFDVKRYIKLAINKIDEIEDKREKREKQKQKRKEKLKNSFFEKNKEQQPSLED